MVKYIKCYMGACCMVLSTCFHSRKSFVLLEQNFKDTVIYHFNPESMHIRKYPKSPVLAPIQKLGGVCWRSL